MPTKTWTEMSCLICRIVMPSTAKITKSAAPAPPVRRALPSTPPPDPTGVDASGCALGRSAVTRRAKFIGCSSSVLGAQPRVGRVLVLFVGQDEGKLRAVLHRPAGMLEEGVWDRLTVDDGVAPFVESHPFGEQLGAHAMGVTFDHVHAKPMRLHCQLPSKAGIGRCGGSPVRQRWWAWWWWTSAPKTSSAVSTKRITPSG